MKIELYKELKAEYKEYLSLVQRLWIYKFTVVGAILTIAVFNKNILPINQDMGLDITVIGLLTLPVLSFLIDFKTLEVGIHVRVISNFISKNFSDHELVSEWENYIWTNKNARIRSTMTLLSSVGTSVFILVACFSIVAYLRQGWTIPLILTGTILFAIPFIAWFAYYAPLWKKE